METSCACVPLQFFRRTRLTDENFLDFDLVGQESSTMKYGRIPDDEQKDRNRLRLISSPPPLSSPGSALFLSRKVREPTSSLAKKKKKRYTTLEKRRKEEVLSTVPRSPPLQLCTWPGRDREHVPLSPPVLEIIPRKQYHFSMYRFSPLDWKETPMFAIASLNLDDFQVERKSGLTKF